EIETRIAAYETAYRMQISAPELMNIAGETQETLRLYNVTPGQPSYAANCLLARRLIERGVRFVQLIHTDWDHHGGGGFDLGRPLEAICREVDQPTAALIKDLKRRGMLGRDHHIDAYTMWLAGGGIKPGIVHGRSDEIGYNVVENQVHVHDLQA